MTRAGRVRSIPHRRAEVEPAEHVGDGGKRERLCNRVDLRHLWCTHQQASVRSAVRADGAMVHHPWSLDQYRNRLSGDAILEHHGVL